MIEIDGSEMARWSAKADVAQLQLLVGTEYSDANDIWLIELVDNSGMTMFDGANGQRVRKPISYFESGIFFFFDEVSGKAVKRFIRDSLSENDRKVLDARNVVSKHGLSVSDLHGDANVMKLASAIENFEERGVVPTRADWNSIHEILCQDKNKDLMTPAAIIVARWVDSRPCKTQIGDGSSNDESVGALMAKRFNPC